MISDERLKQLAAQEKMREQADMAKELLALRKALDGWKLVPAEPTEEMNKAGWAAMNEHDAVNPTYRAMLAAAPEPE